MKRVRNESDNELSSLGNFHLIDRMKRLFIIAYGLFCLFVCQVLILSKHHLHCLCVDSTEMNLKASIVHFPTKNRKVQQLYIQHIRNIGYWHGVRCTQYTYAE